MAVIVDQNDSYFRGLQFHPTLWPTAINEKSARGIDDDAVTLERPMNYGPVYGT